MISNDVIVVWSARFPWFKGKTDVNTGQCEDWSAFLVSHLIQTTLLQPFTPACIFSDNSDASLWPFGFRFCKSIPSCLVKLYIPFTQWLSATYKYYCITIEPWIFQLWDHNKANPINKPMLRSLCIWKWILISGVNGALDLRAEQKSNSIFGYHRD